MASTETGWTTTFPTIVGFYFVRTEQYRELPAEFDGQAVAALHGARFFPDDLVHHHPEFLGPFTVSDAEQLMGLRKALMGVRNGMGCWCKTPFVNISEDRPHEPRCLAVSIALNPSHSQKKETQGK